MEVVYLLFTTRLMEMMLFHLQNSSQEYGYIFLYLWPFQVKLRIHTYVPTHRPTHTQSHVPVTQTTMHMNPTLASHTHNHVIFYNIFSLHYLQTLTNLSDVKNYTFIHLNNSDNFKSCALTHSLFSRWKESYLPQIAFE